MVVDLLVVLGAASLVATFFSRAKLPSIVSFIAAGILVGPSALGLIGTLPQIDFIIEGTALLLMFTIGLEFSFATVLEMRRALVLLGVSQVLITLLVFTPMIAVIFGFPIEKAVFISFLITLSSTAVAMKTLADSRETETPHGKAIISIALVQDIAVIPMIIATPYLAARTSLASGIFDSILPLFILIILGLGIFYLLSKNILPFVLKHAASTKNREVFFFTILFICVGMASLMSAIGLSVSLGAFLAGMLISTSPYGRQATADFLPLRDAFLGLFFVTIGMLLNLQFFFEHFFVIIAIAIVVLALKSIIVFGLVWLLGNSGAVARATTYLAFNIGEFSFLMAEQGLKLDLLSETDRQYFVPVAILSLIATPFVFRDLNAKLTTDLFDRYIPGFLRSRMQEARKSVLNMIGQPLEMSKFETHEMMKDHVIIVGFGLGGQSVARVLTDIGIPCLIIESNAETVAKFKNEYKIVFGDASSSEILHQAGAEHCRMIVLVTAGLQGLRHMSATVERDYPNIPIVARTNYILDLQTLPTSDQTQYVVGEVETSIRILNEILGFFKVDHSRVDDILAQTREKLGSRLL